MAMQTGKHVIHGRAPSVDGVSSVTLQRGSRAETDLAGSSDASPGPRSEGQPVGSEPSERLAHLNRPKCAAA